MPELAPEVQALLDEPNLAHFVTLMRDGSPQVTPVWVTHDGTHVLINTAEGRQKPRNLRRDPRVAVSVVDRNNTQHYVQIRGRVVDMITGEEAWQSINKLASKYSGGARSYPRREGEERILVKILPDHVDYRPGVRAQPQPATR
jgi:PPOX class probable F420-dependent enzyme